MAEENTGKGNPEMLLIGEVYLQSDQSSQKVVVLKEDEKSELFFMMFVGESEFMAIAKEKGLFSTPRPMTHEMYLTILGDTNITFEKVEIHAMVEGTYYANVYLREDGREKVLDARPSDSVALALHVKVPIYVNKDLMRHVLSEKEIEDFKGIIKSVKF